MSSPLRSIFADRDEFERLARARREAMRRRHFLDLAADIERASRATLPFGAHGEPVRDIGATAAVGHALHRAAEEWRYLERSERDEAKQAIGFVLTQFALAPDPARNEPPSQDSAGMFEQVTTALLQAESDVLPPNFLGVASPSLAAMESLGSAMRCVADAWPRLPSEDAIEASRSLAYLAKKLGYALDPHYRGERSEIDRPALLRRSAPTPVPVDDDL
ncbi:hypothetical protein [Neoroseomonas oryzicola]|nr:hypothetical protein [Neoroseomonas oryzicola]NKE18538.1 hypothetical protein [Neoroseomonas oryzicola]